MSTVALVPVAASEAVARLAEITGVVVPVATAIGAVPVTLDTIVAGNASIFTLSAALSEPAAPVVAGRMLMVGAEPPLETIGAVPATPVTVPPPPPPTATQAVLALFRICRFVPLNHRVPAWNCTGGVLALVYTGRVTDPSLLSRRFVNPAPIFLSADTLSVLILLS
jgi:hypothetical protein